MKHLFGVLFISFLCLNASAAHFSLAGIDPNSYEFGIKKIGEAVATDNTEREILQFDKQQSFLLEGKNHQPLGYLIPIKFNSRSYKNTICRLYFLGFHDNLKYANLFAEENVDDDIVSSCAGVEAVSIYAKAPEDAFYLTVVRYRTVNTYGSRGVVVSYKHGTLNYDKKINSCISSKEKSHSLASLKKTLLSCM